MLFVIVGNDEFLMYRAKMNMLSKHIKSGFNHLVPETDMKTAILSAKLSLFNTVLCFDNLKKSELPHLSPLLYEDDKSIIITGLSNIDKVVLKDMTSQDRVIEFFQPYGALDRESYFLGIAKKYFRDEKITVTDLPCKKLVELTGVVNTGDTAYLYYEILKISKYLKSKRITSLDINNLHNIELSGEAGFFSLFDEFIYCTVNTFEQLSSKIFRHVDKDPQFLYGFLNYAFSNLTMMNAGVLDGRKNMREISTILGKKEFYVKSVLEKKISKDRISLLLSLVVGSLVSLETSQGDSIGYLLSSLYMGIEKGI